MTIRKLLIPAAAVLAVAGCSGMKTSNKTSVDEMQLARLPPSSLQDVDAWRLRNQQANDEVARREVDVRDAKRQVDVAKSEVNVAEAQRKRGDKQLEAANKARDEDAAGQARSEIQYAQQHERVAQAHVNMEKQQVNVQEAHKTLAEKEAELTKTRLNEAKYHALRDANDPYAAHYTQAAYDKNIMKAQNEIKDARMNVQRQEEEYAIARDQWQSSRDQLRASTPPAPTG